MRVYQLNIIADRGDIHDQTLIRIYCDNDRIAPHDPGARWAVKDNVEGDPEPNSVRRIEEKEYVDEDENDLQHYGLMCSTDDTLFAISYKSPWTEDGGESNQPEGRMAITVSS